jgi:hypothetical protein
MRAPDHDPGVRHGNRPTCASCGDPITPKRGSRRQRFCSNACKQVAKRARRWASDPATRSAQNAFSEEPLGGTLEATRSVQNTPAKSTTCKGDFGDRGSAFKPVWKVIAGPPVSVANLIIPLHGLPPRRLDPGERAELIRRARAVEYAARWKLTGLKPDGGRR